MAHRLALTSWIEERTHTFKFACSGISNFMSRLFTDIQYCGCIFFGLIAQIDPLKNVPYRWKDWGNNIVASN